MSFLLLKTEPTFDYLTETFTWCFFNEIYLKQYQMCDGTVKYIYLSDFKTTELLFTSKAKDITKEEFKLLTSALGKKLWYYYHEKSKDINNKFERINTLALELEKQGMIK